MAEDKGLGFTLPLSTSQNTYLRVILDEEDWKEIEKAGLADALMVKKVGEGDGYVVADVVLIRVDGDAVTINVAGLLFLD